MSGLKTICPHCGAEAFIPGGGIDRQLRCTKCSGEFNFLSDACGRRFIKAACPHCGVETRICENDLGVPLICASCGGNFSISKAQEEIRLYHTWAAVLWGIGLSPLFGCWLMKKNFDELGMPDEAEEYKGFVKKTVGYAVLDAAAAVLLQLFFVPWAVSAADACVETVRELLAYAAVFSPAVPLLLFGIYILVFFIRYAARSSRAESDCVSYHRYKSSWPPALFLILVLNAAACAVAPALLLIMMIL